MINEMKYYQYDKKRLKNGQMCFIKEKSGKKIHTFLWPQPYYDDCGFQNHPDVVAWLPEPEHICVNPVGWLSEYRGDDLPSESCWCAVCTDKSTLVSRAYFDRSAQRF